MATTRYCRAAIPVAHCGTGSAHNRLAIAGLRPGTIGDGDRGQTRAHCRGQQRGRQARRHGTHIVAAVTRDRTARAAGKCFPREQRRCSTPGASHLCRIALRSKLQSRTCSLGVQSHCTSAGKSWEQVFKNLSHAHPTSCHSGASMLYPRQHSEMTPQPCCVSL